MEVRMADTADFVAYKDVLRAWFRDGKVDEFDWILVDRREFFEEHGFHFSFSFIFP
jgi:hypothetical protein